jgi:hypothetical protein
MGFVSLVLRIPDIPDATALQLLDGTQLLSIFLYLPAFVSGCFFLFSRWSSLSTFSARAAYSLSTVSSFLRLLYSALHLSGLYTAIPNLCKHLLFLVPVGLESVIFSVVISSFSVVLSPFRFRRSSDLLQGVTAVAFGLVSVLTLGNIWFYVKYSREADSLPQTIHLVAVTDLFLAVLSVAQLLVFATLAVVIVVHVRKVAGRTQKHLQNTTLRLSPQNLLHSASRRICISAGMSTVAYWVFASLLFAEGRHYLDTGSFVFPVGDGYVTTPLAELLYAICIAVPIYAAQLLWTPPPRVARFPSTRPLESTVVMRAV